MNKKTYILLPLFLLASTFALAIEMSPNETISICNTTIHCNASPCNETSMCYKYISDEYVNITYAIIDVFNSTILDIDDKLHTCIDKTLCSESLAECMTNLDKDRTELKDTLKELSTCETDVLKCNNILSMTDEQFNTQYCTDEMEERDKCKKDKLTYTVLFGIGGFALAWWIKSKGVSKDKDLETHEPRRGV